LRSGKTLPSFRERISDARYADGGNDGEEPEEIHGMIAFITQRETYRE
jgi:hypothetical protein